MRQKRAAGTGGGEKMIRDIRRATRRQYSAEEKIRIVLDGLRGEDSIAELCRRERINQNLYYRWSKEFLGAGKKRLAGDTAREATSEEVKGLRRQAVELKEVPPCTGSATFWVNWPDSIVLDDGRSEALSILGRGLDEDGQPLRSIEVLATALRLFGADEEPTDPTRKKIGAVCLGRLRRFLWVLGSSRRRVPDPHLYCLLNFGL